MLNLVNEFNYFEQERLFVIIFKCVFSLKKKSTLDYFELNHADLEFNKNSKGNTQQVFNVSESCTILYGEVPHDIMK